MSDYRRTASPSQMMEHSYTASQAETKTAITSSVCNLYGFEVQNNSSTTEVFLQIFLLPTASVTVGVTSPSMVFRIPAGANYGKDPQSFPIKYGSGLTIACTNARTGAVAPNAACSVNLWYWDKGN